MPLDSTDANNSRFALQSQFRRELKNGHMRGFELTTASFTRNPQPSGQANLKPEKAMTLKDRNILWNALRDARNRLEALGRVWEEGDVISVVEEFLDNEERLVEILEAEGLAGSVSRLTHARTRRLSSRGAAPTPLAS